MPLSPETLNSIKENLDKAKEHMDSLQSILNDQRASGIDASGIEAQLNTLRQEYNKWLTFYNLQSARNK